MDNGISRATKRITNATTASEETMISKVTVAM
jgi:hypothetical protein